MATSHGLHLSLITGYNFLFSHGIKSVACWGARCDCLHHLSASQDSIGQ